MPQRRPLTPEQRVLRARAAAYAKWSRQDPNTGTAAARAAFLTRFEDQVDPDRRLSEPERHRRAAAALKAHMTALSLKSSRDRASRRSDR